MNFSLSRKVKACFSLTTLAIGISLSSLAADKADPQDLNVKKFRKQYWSQGKEYSVVQNRVYAKAERFEIALFGGVTSSDPFLSEYDFGGSLGYHFDETWSAHLLGWKSLAKASRALQVLEKDTGTTTNTNPPQYFWGAEGNFSAIYGKLSVLGAAIIYYDFHLAAGTGFTNTETGNNWTLLFGLGQRTHLNDFLTLRIDYRFGYYEEDIKEKVATVRLGQVVTRRSNFSHHINLGVSFLI